MMFLTKHVPFPALPFFKDNAIVQQNVRPFTAHVCLSLCTENESFLKFETFLFHNDYFWSLNQTRECILLFNLFSLLEMRQLHNGKFVDFHLNSYLY